MTPNPPAHVPDPIEAHRVGPWVDEDGDGSGWGRYVRGVRRDVAGAAVVVAGWQDAAGDVDWHGSVTADGAEADSARLRMLAAALLNAADELDQRIGATARAVDRGE